MGRLRTRAARGRSRSIPCVRSRANGRRPGRRRVDPEAAEALKGARFRPPQPIAAPSEDEYYYDDLIGLEAVDVAGTPTAGSCRS